jgi:hypothetical protein
MENLNLDISGRRAEADTRRSFPATAMATAGALTMPSLATAAASSLRSQQDDQNDDV